MVSKDNKVKLIDFGIAKKFTNSFDKDEQPSFRFTAKFITQISSPLYAAPEIISDECYDESVDIWGIGVIWLILVSLPGTVNSTDNFRDLNIREEYYHHKSILSQ